MRAPFIYKAGADYYHKPFPPNTGRNRWGDFTTCQVDPCDDMTLWTLQEYAKPRTATANDGTTGSNSSRWATRWAAVSGPALAAGLICPRGPIGTPAGTRTPPLRI